MKSNQEVEMALLKLKGEALRLQIAADAAQMRQTVTKPYRLVSEVSATVGLWPWARLLLSQTKGRRLNKPLKWAAILGVGAFIVQKMR
ncbi:MAG: hypothetical protein KA498_06190 [Neisseriaceae bacterium]|nr:hypothetical protein [Neisseriaceae bacterium]